MISKIIIVIAAPFGERDYMRYGIEVIKQSGMGVSVLNLLPLLYPDVYRNVTLPDPIRFSGLIEIQSQEQFDEEVKKSRSSSVVYLTTYFNLSTLFIYRTINRYKVPYCVTGMNAVPSFSNEYSVPLTERLKKITLRKILFKIFSRLPFEIMGIPTANMVTVIADKASYRRPEVTPTTRVVYTHSSDYDNYMEANRLNEAVTPGIVYLDNYLPYHSDAIYVGEKNPVTASVYHASLNRFFDGLEKLIGKKVIIAAHPKSEYTESNNPFNGREIIRRNTASLVKNAEIVVLNFSTSMNYAMLFYKPVVFFTTDELEQVALYQKHIKGIAGMFGKKAFNIDHPYKLEKESLYTIDRNAYAKYINDYIKKNGSPEKHSWQIKCEAFKQILNP